MPSDPISEFLQDELRRRSLDEVAAVEAAGWLDRSGRLADDPGRPGKPLRQLMREGKVCGAEQRPPRAHGRWFVVRKGIDRSMMRASPAIDRGDHGVEKSDEPVDITVARATFKPERVRVLLVGESRPAGGTFFYLENSILFQATREAFLRVRVDVEPGAFLREFMAAGCYLEDLCDHPVNRLAEREREAARAAAVPGLIHRLRGLEPDVVIVVMRAIADDVRRALSGAGLGSVPVEVVPFPRKKHRATYVREMSEYFRRWVATG